ncbi:UDP-N-acetylglucosamine transferase subunit ALG14 homolog isoform X2 [Triplophysa rosa]|uniref:UDP-N-acetylglucosamine transferase subunit ALG14 n=1 Tax=Triplophysa rosa TaxID=992332 RepID=A0A9W7TAL8_TRIRA|nr:UDP-N-acetylglucosamine transferase subunit ALG14 homolog isoform X2 [Triplophysa rosa]KAI7792684.1 UDP-N-acetylglucosamine transferase subunit ALG14-like protein [Triplophysa rosa]
MGLLCGALCGVIVTLVTVFILRIFVTLRHGSKHKPGKKGPVSVLVVAGSGGHTTEIIRLMGALSPFYKPRHYVLADTDKMSEEKIRAFEAEREKTCSASQFTLHRIPRSREVRQSWSSSVLTSLSALVSSIPLLFRLQPDVVLCNGPGTCVPLCAAGILLGVLGVKRVLIVFVESICRVETLSLSGKILYYFADYFFVQWVPLKDKYPKAIYLGRLV